MSRQLDHLFASLVSDVLTGPAPVPQGRQIRSSFRLEFTNTMRVPVFWRNALGIVVCEPSCTSMSADEYFYINIEYEFDPGVKIDARELLDELDLPNNHVELKGIVDALAALERNPHWYQQRKFSYQLGISREALENVGGVAYLNDVDLVVGFDKHRDAVLHPFSPPGQRQRLSDVLDPHQGFQQRYLIVDNAGIIGPRWVNTGYGTYEITPVADPQYRDGVYVSVYHDRQNEPTTTHYTIEQADKDLGLYRNQAEAVAFGAPEERFKAELKEIEQQIARDKLTLTQQKQELDHERHAMEMERKREDDRRAHEQAELEAERRREDDRRAQEKAEMEAERRREDDRRAQEKADLDAERKRDAELLERERERITMAKERIDFERQTFQERQKFEYDMRSRDRKDQTDQSKALLDMGKTALALVNLALTAYALFKKSQ